MIVFFDFYAYSSVIFSEISTPSDVYFRVRIFRWMLFFIRAKPTLVCHSVVASTLRVSIEPSFSMIWTWSCALRPNRVRSLITWLGTHCAAKSMQLERPINQTFLPLVTRSAYFTHKKFAILKNCLWKMFNWAIVPNPMQRYNDFLTLPNFFSFFFTFCKSFFYCNVLVVFLGVM